MSGPRDDRRPVLAGLDHLEGVALSIYAALLGVVALAALVALGFLILNPPPSFGLQGEWFFVGIGFLLVMGWIASQIAGIMRRRRRVTAPQDDLPAFDLERVISEQGGLPGGFLLQWGASREQHHPGRKQPGLSWSFQSAPVASRIFKVDAAQLRAARTAHDAGQSWEAISRSVNADYENLSPLEQEFYRRALEMAVNEDTGSSPGAENSPRD